jgi:hypothetical protein
MRLWILVCLLSLVAACGPRAQQQAGKLNVVPDCIIPVDVATDAQLGGVNYSGGMTGSNTCGQQP